MNLDSYITMGVILVAIILFITELLSIDLVAILIIGALVTTGVISPEEGVQGFGNTATLTVALMFVVSNAMLKTGALQYVADRLSTIFEKNYTRGMILMMLMIAFVSAFINNTPVVAVFIPVVIQVAREIDVSPKRMLIPLSFASIFGGSCTLVGTSTNMLVSGIAEQNKLSTLEMFDFAPIGVAFLIAGMIYMLLIGNKILPRDKSEELDKEFNVKKYLTEIELDSQLKPGKEITCSIFSDLDIDIVNINRNGKNHAVPREDFELKAGDILKIRGDTEEIGKFKSWVADNEYFSASFGVAPYSESDARLVELIILNNSPLVDMKISEIGFQDRYRAIPLGVKQREEILNENLSNYRLKAGDIILVETKKSYIGKVKEKANQSNAHFAILSEKNIPTFNPRNFYIVGAIIASVILTASLGILNILTAALLGVSLLVLTRVLTMKEVYKSIDWQVIFLLAGSLSLGVAMQSSGLDKTFANAVIDNLSVWGPSAIISGLFISTVLLTSIISNNAAVALFAPIAIVTAQGLDLSPTPFILSVALAGSASFITPIGYQTNTMVYSAGKYKFLDFFKVGIFLNILLWAVATFFIPWWYGI